MEGRGRSSSGGSGSRSLSNGGSASVNVLSEEKKMERKVTYVEPADYFTEAMLKAAEEYDRTHELEKAAEESNKAANNKASK